MRLFLGFAEFVVRTSTESGTSQNIPLRDVRNALKTRGGNAKHKKYSPSGRRGGTEGDGVGDIFHKFHKV